jgi:shikimate kinase
MPKTIILIGFKHTGKSVLGEALAKKLNTDFIDLDCLIEKHYSMSCRKIAQIHGLDYFRKIESEMLLKALFQSPGVLALGGGTPLAAANRILIAQGRVIHVRAPKGRIFERIMITGRPAFFPEGVEAHDAFVQIWEERDPIYRSLADYSIDNLGSIYEGVEMILAELNEKILA